LKIDDETVQMRAELVKIWNAESQLAAPFECPLAHLLFVSFQHENGVTNCGIIAGFPAIPSPVSSG